MSSQAADPQELSPSPADRGKTTRAASSEVRKKTGKSVNFVLQGKGGVGKTLTASLVAQYLMETGRAPACYDTDPLNESFVGIRGLSATEVRLLNDDSLNAEAVDLLVEKILTTDTDIVVDAGAASFVPLSRYLIENNIAELIEGAGKRMVVHSVIVGGGNTIDTAKGLEAILASFPASVKVVVWLNEFFGPVAVDGAVFGDWALYKRYRDRISGTVQLGRQSQQFSLNIGQMLERKLTFAEALADPAFMTVPRQRLTMFRRSIWEQLAAVI